MAASDALRPNWDSKNLGPKVDMPAMRVASAAPARQRKTKVGFFRSSSSDLQTVTPLVPAPGPRHAGGSEPSAPPWHVLGRSSELGVGGRGVTPVAQLVGLGDPHGHKLLGACRQEEGAAGRRRSFQNQNQPPQNQPPHLHI